MVDSVYKYESGFNILQLEKYVLKFQHKINKIWFSLFSNIATVDTVQKAQ